MSIYQPGQFVVPTYTQKSNILHFLTTILFNLLLKNLLVCAARNLLWCAFRAPSLILSFGVPEKYCIIDKTLNWMPRPIAVSKLHLIRIRKWSVRLWTGLHFPFLISVTCCCICYYWIRPCRTCPMATYQFDEWGQILCADKAISLLHYET